MSLSVRLPLFLACGFAGYLLGQTLINGPSEKSEANRGSKLPEAVEQLVPATAAESSFIAEWEQLRATHASGPEGLPTLYAEVKELKDAFRRRAYRSALLAEWAVSNPQAALAYLSEKDSAMVTQLLREWLRLDPNAAINALLAGNEKQKGNLRSVLNDIARLAPDRLAQVLSS